MHRARGFTLIELMVTLVIVGILTAIAVPAYRQSVIKGNRRAAQSAMMDIVNREHQYFVANRAYDDGTALCALPTDIGENYTCAIDADNDAAPPTFTVNFTATGGQASDGNLSVDNFGEKLPADKW
jgi:type IV pilus assembly protein PilE